MQTVLRSFDWSIFKGVSGTDQKTTPGAGKPATDATSDQLAGFMEIMSALLALPPEQWKQSMAGLEEMSAEGEPETVPWLVGNAGQPMPPAELLKLMMNMKGAVLQELQSAKADGNPHSLLDIDGTLMEDPQIAALGSQEAGQGQSVQGADPETLLSQARNVSQDGLTTDPGENGEGRSFPEVIQGTGKGGNPLAPEAATDGENKFPTVQKEESPGTSRQPNQMNDFLFKTSDAQTEGAPAPDPDKTRTSLEAGVAKTPVQDNLPDEQGQAQAVDKGHQTLTADSVKDSVANAQSRLDGENLEDRFVQKPDPSAGEHQGLQWRSEAGRESKSQAVYGAKEMMPQEKAEPSEVIRQIVQRMSMQTSGDQSRMIIRLKPEFLGNMHLHVLTENHQVTVRMMADSTLVKDIVEQNIAHLRAELQHHGLEIQKFDVFVANDEQGWRGGEQQAGFKDTQNQKQSRSGGGKSRHQRGRIALGTDSGKKNVEQDPGEIDYFA